MTMYAITNEEEELGFMPIDYLGYNPKCKVSHLFPQDLFKDTSKRNLSYQLTIEASFAGLEGTPIESNLKNTRIPKINLEKLILE